MKFSGISSKMKHLFVLVPLMISCGGLPSNSNAPGRVPDITGVSPDTWSKSSKSVVIVHGEFMNSIPKNTGWTILGCDVVSYTGEPVTDNDYQLVLTPGRNNQVGDWCGLRLDVTGQALSYAFKTAW